MAFGIGWQGWGSISSSPALRLAQHSSREQHRHRGGARQGLPSSAMPSSMLQVLRQVAGNGELVNVALNTHGTRAVQKLIETLTSREQASRGCVEFCLGRRSSWVQETAAGGSARGALFCCSTPVVKLRLPALHSPLVRPTHSPSLLPTPAAAHLKLLPTRRHRLQVQLVIDALKPGVVSLIRDLNGNHVVQRCLQVGGWVLSSDGLCGDGRAGS